jgi:nucleotide-binding universal stress UspA family protein
MKMFKINKLLVPVDFSPRSEAAARHAAMIAKRFDSEILFVYAIPHGPYEHGLFDAAYNGGSVWPSPEEIEIKVSEQMTEFIEKTAPGVQTFSEVGFGGAAERIREAAEREQVDLIVMPTHGYGPFRRFILGSVTAKTLHDVPFPVMTGAHVEATPEGKVEPYQVIACSVDLSPHSEVVLNWAKEFAAAVGAELHVIHAAPSIEGLPGEREQWPENLSTTLIEHRARQVNELLTRCECTAEVHVDCAEIDQFVSTVVENLGADLLIIGRSADGRETGRLRSHSMGLIRESACPVVSI